MRNRTAWGCSLCIVVALACASAALFHLTHDRKLAYIKASGGAVVFLESLGSHCNVEWCTGRVTDEDLEYLSQLRYLVMLDVSGNPQITDGGLKRIAAIRAQELILLDVTDTGVSEEGVLEFMRENPRCDVCWRGETWTNGLQVRISRP